MMFLFKGFDVFNEYLVIERRPISSQEPNLQPDSAQMNGANYMEKW